MPLSNHIGAKLLLHFAAFLVCVVTPALVPGAAYAAGRAESVAEEAIDAALTLPPGYKRDVVLRTVSRNLRWFGQPEAGLRAARAMTDGGVSEIPPGGVPGPPRLVPLKEALPSGSPCDAGLWHQAGGGEARTPADREAWAQACLLTRDFHWIGLPPVEQVRSAATGLPMGAVKAELLAMLVRAYGDADTLRFVRRKVDRDGPRLPKDIRDAVAEMLAEPAVLYRLSRKDEALASARKIGAFAPRAALIRLLAAAGDTEAAAAIFELLSDTPPEFGEDCFGWFGPIGGLGLSHLGNALNPAPGIGTFLDRLPASPLFARICPNGLDAELAVEHLLASGRFDEAVARARREKTSPFLLIDALLQVGQVKFRSGERSALRAHAEEAAAVLPPFDPGDPIGASEANRMSIVVSATATDRPRRRFGERRGDTRRRFEVIRMLAAAGAAAEADALARRQPAGALRAVALSAAVAGRAGLRFDNPALSLSDIGADDL